MAAEIDWVCGDILGHDLPAHAAALREGGPAYLTRAFRAAGALSADNHVTDITRCDLWAGGSTGAKLALSVRYDRAEPGLPEELFVKFSRDFDDPIRDRGKVQMESEVRFALLSRIPDFPVAVPRCLFADYHLETGTGILIAERIAFGADGNEPHYPKCRDYEVPDLLGHYEALVSALARLAARHRAGAFPADVMDHFAPEKSNLSVSDRKPYAPQQIRNRVSRLAEFAARHPGLLPPAVIAPDFLERLAEEGARISHHADALAAILHGDGAPIALCHWNANIDNGWFWRDPEGRIHCGLMDWGNVGQMNMAVALAGCLMAAEPDFLVAHIDRLFQLFAAELTRHGGGTVDIETLTDHFALYIASSGLTWLLDAPALITRLVPDLGEVKDRFDPRIADEEFPRNQLNMLTMFLTLWKTLDFGARLDHVLARAEEPAQA
jgi:hypothetical protein